MRNMKRTLLLLSLCIAIPAGSAWAVVIGSTNVTDFSATNFVDWSFLGPGGYGAPLSPLVIFTSTGGDSGGVALGTPSAPSGASLYSLVQGSPDWAGNFPNGMSLIYNGATAPIPNTPDSILIAFTQPEIAIGAYIQTVDFGSFTATLSLYDASGNFLGAFPVPPVSNGNSFDSTADGGGGALFLGAFSGTPFSYAVFSASSNSVLATNQPDFAIGQLQVGLGSGVSFPCAVNDDFCTQVEDELMPEPASLLLISPALLGLVAFTRRRRAITR